MTLFDIRAAEQRASRFLAPGAPTGLAEGTSAAFRATRLSETTIGANVALIDTYDEYIEEIFQATGQKLVNPVFVPGPTGDTALIGEGGVGLPVPPSLSARLDGFTEQVRKIGLAPRSAPELKEQSFEKIRAAVLANEDVAARGGFTGLVGQFVGGAAAVVTDPPVLASMLVGAPAASGILRTALIEAGIAVTVETAIQPSIQRFRAEAGLPAGVAEAFKNIAFAGLAGGTFAAGVKATVVGGRALLGSMREVSRVADAARLDAERFLEREVSLQEETPFDIALPVARREHVDRMSRAQSDLATTGVFRLSDEPLSPTRPDVRTTTLRAEDAPGVSPEVEAGFAVGQGMRESALDSLSDRERARAARETARQLLGVPGLEDLLDVVRRPPRAPRTRSLTQFLKDQGGVKDPTGDLRGMGLTARARPGLVNKSGITLDEAAERATEEGFFGPRDEPVSTNALLDALDEDFNRGRPRLTEDDEAVQAEFDQISRGVDELQRALDDLGIDVQGVTNEAVQEQIQALAEVPEEVSPGTLRQTSAARQLGAEAARLEPQADLMDDALEVELRDVFGIERTEQGEQRVVPGAERISDKELAERQSEQPLRTEVEQKPADEGLFDVEGRKQQDLLDQEFLFGEGDELTGRTAREVFDEIEEDAELLRNWDDCLKGAFGE